MADNAFTFHPLTAARFDDLETLFGPKGASDGCWCMYWRVTAKAWKAGDNAERKSAMCALLDDGAVPGLIAYDGDMPVAWCQITPRAEVPRFNTTRTGKPEMAADATRGDVWAITCFFIAKSHRNQGLMTALVNAACAFAKARGARVVEGAPIEPQRPLIWGEGYVGIASAFRAAGFEEVARRTPIRPFMRRVL